MQKEIGKNTLGGGKKMTVDMKTYNRSTHNLGYIWRNTQSPGTLVPFMKTLALPGDIIDIDLDAKVLTHPTVGPLYGSYKLQMDVFTCPIRLYVSALHNNSLKVGLNMAKVKLPHARVHLFKTWAGKYGEFSQVNPSSLLSYLGVNGFGITDQTEVDTEFQCVPLLAYWDIFKNYYANKQEENAYFVTKEGDGPTSPTTITSLDVASSTTNFTYKTVQITYDEPITGLFIPYINSYSPQRCSIAIKGDFTKYSNAVEYLSVPGTIYVEEFGGVKGPFTSWTELIEIIASSIQDTAPDGVTIVTTPQLLSTKDAIYIHWETANNSDIVDCYGTANASTFNAPITIKSVTPDIGEISIRTFPISNIDDMREDILQSPFYTEFIVSEASMAPYGKILETSEKGANSCNSQYGLALKTYQSDLFNNWINSEWIEGSGSINELTAVSTADGSFTIDALNIAQKVYNMLNRIALSDGTYRSWLETVYTNEYVSRCESPVYEGGLSQEIVFDEVISTSGSTAQGNEPLGTLAGRGTLMNNRKGGSLKIKVDEPSYIIGIVSITPRLDYSQGNDFDIELATLDDLHKPELDAIGFQDMPMSWMAWSERKIGAGGQVTERSLGKQPAWIQYMTNFNRTKGNFAINNNEAFMVLNRNYTIAENGEIQDATTYIDPVKYNYVFADTNLDAMNFWVQIGVQQIARRKMSAKVIPNL